MRLRRTIFVFLALFGASVVFGCSGGQQAGGGGLNSSGGISAPGGTGATEAGDQEVPDDDGVIDNPEEAQAEPTQVEITTSSLKTGTVGKKITKKILYAKGGSCGKKVCTYSWEVQGLPNGLSLTGCSKDPAPQVTGEHACIEGTPEVEGSFDVSIQATDKDDQTLFASKTLTLVVNPKPAEPQPQMEFLTPGAVIEGMGITQEQPIKVFLDSPKPDNKSPKGPNAIPEINVQGNVDLSTPLFLRFHAEGGCGGYMWPAGINHYPRPATNMWSYTAEQCIEKASGGQGPQYCQKLTKIKPYLSDWNLDPIHTIEAIVEDSCGNVARQQVRLVYRYPPDMISTKHPDGVLHLCMHLQKTSDWGGSGRQFDIWITASQPNSRCTDEDANWTYFHSGACDVASYHIQAGDDLAATHDYVPQAMATGSFESIISDAPEYGGNYYLLWGSLGGMHRGCGDLVQNRYFCLTYSSKPKMDLIWLMVASKHWYQIAFDDRFGDYLKGEITPGDRTLDYSYIARNANGGMWLRRPIGINETGVCGLPDHLLGGGEEMQGDLPPAVCSPMPDCAKNTGTLPSAVDSEHPPQQ